VTNHPHPGDMDGCDEGAPRVLEQKKMSGQSQGLRQTGHRPCSLMAMATEVRPDDEPIRGDTRLGQLLVLFLTISLQI
jgi:hypothetical protein